MGALFFHKKRSSAREGQAQRSPFFVPQQSKARPFAAPGREPETKSSRQSGVGKSGDTLQIGKPSAKRRFQSRGKAYPSLLESTQWTQTFVM